MPRLALLASRGDGSLSLSLTLSRVCNVALCGGVRSAVAAESWPLSGRGVARPCADR
jgi:hypothetical protein